MPMNIFSWQNTDPKNLIQFIGRSPLEVIQKIVAPGFCKGFSSLVNLKNECFQTNQERNHTGIFKEYYSIFQFFLLVFIKFRKS